MTRAPADPAAPAFRFLCDALARDGAQAGAGERQARLAGFIAGGPDWPALAWLSGEQQVTPALAPALARWGLLAALPADLRDYLEAAAALNRARNRQLLAELEQAALALNAAGLEPLALKGAANLLDRLHADPAERLLVDLDLLVAPGELACAEAALRAAGWQRVGAAGMTEHHLPALHRPGHLAPLELHGQPLDLPWRRLLAAEELLADSSPCRLGAAWLRLPADPHRLALALAHGTLADRALALGRLPLRDLDDAARLLARLEDPAAAGLERRFAAVGQGAALAAALLALEQLLGAPALAGGLPAADRRSGNRLLRAALRATRQPRRAAARARLARPWLLLRRSLRQPALRRRLFKMLGSPGWYRRQWRSLRRS